ncbi:ParB/RepB/Spo0J family partition protein [Pseudonocardia kujensis]|uniref:ParB/RepB/Spo0J family partition protein n=1 Tax=Pseudonocardia kujensis TaxID=1128675 RepID=UPI001E508B2F|nr:ParB/RepB/Spo0J family partition protein [Pseudonocardia kujensis]MCE0766004.1 ParB/RepB/Spo0J family partition protein [Pseudonocardia kujensis]
MSCPRLAMHPRNIRTTLTDLDKLAASIRAEGVPQPQLAHARFERRPGVADLEVIDGHRRLAAAEIAGLRQVPVIVRPRVPHDDTLFAMLGAALKADVEDPVKAKAVTVLNEEFDYTWPEIAARLQLPRDTVLTWRQDRPQARPARPRRTRQGNTGTRAPRTKPSVVHEMCARFDRRSSPPSSCAPSSGTGSPA